MIVTNVTGGLGNQLFQYAAGRRLSLIHGTDLKLCADWYRAPGAPSDRNFLLHNFKIQAVAADEKDMSLVRNQEYRQRAFNYRDDFEKITDQSFLVGYWQSEKFFGDSADIIRAELSFREENLRAASDEAIGSIKAEEPDAPIVAVHVRRGDYIRPEITLGQHPPVTANYLQAAMKQCPAESRFLFFSDDEEGINWCRRHFDGPRSLYSEGRSALDDFCLMTLCDHNIIANSSFSWWAAWLNVNRGRTVIAPDPTTWLGPDLADWSTVDLLPEDWIVLSA